MKCFRYTLLLLSLLIALPIEGHRILCVFPFNGKSHFRITQTVCKILSEHGHQIDMISHFPMETPTANYTDIVNLDGTRKAVNNNFSVIGAKCLNRDYIYHLTTMFGNTLCTLMGHEQIQKLIKNPPKDPPYDLVITEYLSSNCFLALGRLLNASLVTIVTGLEFAHMSEAIGNPLSSSFFPNVLIDFPVLSNFWQRLMNILENLIQPLMFHWYMSVQTDMMKKYFGQDMPAVWETEKDISLMLVNGHYSFHGIRPITPALIEIAGLHVETDDSQLSPDLQKWMDDAKDGIVYFTLGSMLKIETFANATILDLYASFKKIAPIKVLMKIANKDELPPGIPNNIVTSPWIPQIAVLRHKNMRAFITHGGALGSYEALYYGIPVIGIPIFGDQPRHINIFVHKGMGIRVDLENISEKSMDAALDAVLNDPSYMRSAKYESSRFKDRPMTVRETTIYWIEYILRHGPRSLRSPAMDMPWWQTNSFDVYGFLIACIIMVMYLLAIIVKAAIRFFSRNKSHNEINKTKKY